jgi:hypothetical protein
MTEQELNSDRELLTRTLSETVNIEDINAELAIKIKEVERRNRELGERMVGRIPTRPQTIYIDPAVGE